MAVYENSRYIRNHLYNRNNEVQIFEIGKKAVFPEENITYYQIRVGDTVDRLAYTNYGDARLWWAIMNANPRYLSEMSIKVGDIIAIPAYQDIVDYLSFGEDFIINE